MRILITGASGMIGRKLALRLAADGQLGGQPISALTLFDVVSGVAPAGVPSRSVTGNLTDPAVIEDLISERPDVIYHIAAIVSGEAELDFDKGYAVNLDASRLLFEAVRKAGGGYRPRVIFASSIGAYGAPFPDTIPDEFNLTPLTSYGTQKAMTEFLVNDYSRRGFFDGIGIRLPTIVVRPGAPNKAASGFFSSIIREPLVGLEAVLPVSPEVRHYVASPRSAVGFFVHAGALDFSQLGGNRNLVMPGLGISVGEMIEGLRRVAGDQAVNLIRRESDPMIERIVAGWPRNFEARRSRELGFAAESRFDDIVSAHVEDELGGRVGPR